MINLRCERSEEVPLGDETCFCRELERRNLEDKRQLEVPIVYDGIVFNEGLRLDIIVENTIICEIKAASRHLWH